MAQAECAGETVPTREVLGVGDELFEGLASFLSDQLFETCAGRTSLAPSPCWRRFPGFHSPPPCNVIFMTLTCHSADIVLIED